MNIETYLFTVLEEQNILRTSKTKPLVNAITNRNPITFFYSGPTKGKDSVKSGTRINGEAVALGLSKKGNLIIRVFVPSPNVSKKGFNKTNWRTFMVSRMSNVKIDDTKTFDQQKPQYKSGDDDSMTVTYVTTDWGKKPEVKKPRIIKPLPSKKIEPKKEVPTTEPQKPEELPQPKPQSKPEPIPTTEVPPKEEPNQNYSDEQKRLYDLKVKDWASKQKELGLNTKPGQGTRTRFNKEIEKELPQPKPQEKPSVNPEEDQEDNKLQESLKRIKRLMF
jgi:hypothetical protein